MDLFNPGLDPVEPVKTLAPWLGGKRRLGPALARLIDAIPHDLYAEPFLGMGGVFFRRARRPRVEVVNDISEDVVNLFRILQRHYQSFVAELKFTLTGRACFERLNSANPATLTDLERAARFLYLQRLAFGGKVTGRSFGVNSSAPGRFNLTTLEPRLADIHERLAGVVIERLDWAAFVDNYDREGALFYFDPPYFGGESDYGKGIFDRTAFAAIAARIRSMKGAAIVSLNDRPEIREVFAGLQFLEVELLYTVHGGAGTEARELIILNDKAHAAISAAGAGMRR